MAAETKATADRHSIVRLDPEHSGFRDEEYRALQPHRAHRAGVRAGRARPRRAVHRRGARRLARRLGGSGAGTRAPRLRRILSCVRRLELPRERIPQMREVSARVEALSGFRLEPVAGLVEPRVFLESLANGVFLSTQYIRHHSTPLHTPEPDVVHENVGHAVTLASERLAELNRLIGRAVRRAQTTEELERLSRIYWFTIEFGVLCGGSRVKAYGTGRSRRPGSWRRCIRRSCARSTWKRRRDRNTTPRTSSPCSSAPTPSMRCTSY